MATPPVKATLLPINVFVTVAGVYQKCSSISVTRTVVGTENCAPAKTPSGAATFRV